ncbi:hypothetical protein P3T37_000534 [Kitasatospora sp. MAA4]|nr:hypothetical protein [Kitasatospora sp. MAA4]MDH6131165.1 hypothetical protein [Kitasatospora sp. MAA4]
MHWFTAPAYGHSRLVLQKVTAEAMSLEKSLKFITDLKDRLTK